MSLSAISRPLAPGSILRKLPVPRGSSGCCAAKCTALLWHHFANSLHSENVRNLRVDGGSCVIRLSSVPYRDAADASFDLSEVPSASMVPCAMSGEVHIPVAVNEFIPLVAPPISKQHRNKKNFECNTRTSCPSVSPHRAAVTVRVCPRQPSRFVSRVTRRGPCRGPQAGTEHRYRQRKVYMSYMSQHFSLLIQFILSTLSFYLLM